MDNSTGMSKTAGLAGSVLCAAGVLAFFVGLFLGLSIFFLYKGYQVGQASRVGPVYGSSLLITVLAGIVVLGERERVVQKIAGAVVAFGGVILLRLL